MKLLKTENEGETTTKTTFRYTFVAPGSIGKGRGRGHGLRSLVPKDSMSRRTLFPQSSALVNHYLQSFETGDTIKSQGNKDSTMVASQGMKISDTTKSQGDKHSTMVAAQGMKISDTTKSQGDKHSTVAAAQAMKMSDTTKSQGDKLSTMAAAQAMKMSDTTKRQGDKYSTMAAAQGMEASMQTPKRTNSFSAISSGKRMRVVDKDPLVLQEEHLEVDNLVTPSTGPAVGACTPKKKKRVRGSNKCKEVVSLEAGKKLKVTFYNNRTVGKNGRLFSRHLGKIVRDRNMCPLAVSSWSDIKKEQLDHMWAVVEDKFKCVDFNDHRKDIIDWMRELWNKWRGYLHGTYVKNKKIHQVLKKTPPRVDPQDWEWLVKEHFFSKNFQERSARNAVNRSKLKMPHHIGSKPIREIIYEKGGKDGNPPDLATIFFDTHKKNDRIVEPEAIEKHAEIKEMVQSDPSLSNIEIIEKCCGTQNRSHVFGFGGGLRAKDLKGGASSKPELLSQLRSTQKENKVLTEENKFLHDRLFVLEDKLKGIEKMEDKLKDLDRMREFFAQLSQVPATASHGIE